MYAALYRSIARRCVMSKSVCAAAATECITLSTAVPAVGNAFAAAAAAAAADVTVCNAVAAVCCS